MNIKTKVCGTVCNRVRPKLGTLALKAKMVSPEAALVVGLVAGVATVVMAVKAAKSDESDDLEIVAEEIAVRHQNQNNPEEELTPKEFSKIIMPLYGEYTGKWLRLYGPTLLMGSLSVALLLTSNGMLRSRNKALVASLNLMQQTYNQYRRRVREEFGPEVDERLHKGGVKKTVTKVIETEDGKKKEKEEQTVIAESPELGIYQRIFDDSNNSWVPDRERNMFFLETAEHTLNDIYRIRGWVLLNEALKAVNLPQTPEGAVAGWSRQNAEADPSVDDYIDFGLRDSINQHEVDNRIFLDFNCQGVMYQYIE